MQLRMKQPHDLNRLILKKYIHLRVSKLFKRTIFIWDFIVLHFFLTTLANTEIHMDMVLYF